MNEEKEKNTNKNDDEKLAIDYTIADVLEALVDSVDADEEE